MKKFCIFSQENHPNNMIGDIYGPFDTWEAAASKAEELESSPSNYNAPYEHKYYRFRAQEMETC